MKRRVAFVSIGLQMDTLGIAYLAAALDAADDFEVRRFRLLPWGAKAFEVPDTEELSEDEIKVIHQIIEFDPEFVGFSLLHQIFSLHFLHEGCSLLKAANPKVHICCGGHFATTNAPELMRRYPLIDTVAYGEGDETIIELLQATARTAISGIPAASMRHGARLEICQGIYYRSPHGEIIKTAPRPLVADLDALPFPVRDPEFFSEGKRYATPILTSRGCTGVCAFCDQPGITKYQPGRRWRGRSVKTVVDEIERIHKDFGEKYFTIVDSSFEDPNRTIGFRRMKQFAEELLARRLEIRYYVNFRAETFQRKPEDLDILKRLVRSGLTMVFCGLESFIQRDLDLYGKRATVEDNLRALQTLSQFPVSVRKGMILFNPYTTIDDLRDNHRQMQRNGMNDTLRHFLMQLAVFSGTGLISILERDGLLIEDKFMQSYYCYRFTDHRVEPLAAATRHLTIHPEIMRRWVQIEENRLIGINLRRDWSALLGKEVGQLDQKTEEIACDLRQINDAYFDAAVSLAEHKWDDAKYKRIEEEYIFHRFVPAVDRLFEALTEFRTSAAAKLGYAAGHNPFAAPRN